MQSFYKPSAGKESCNIAFTCGEDHTSSVSEYTQHWVLQNEQGSGCEDTGNSEWTMAVVYTLWLYIYLDQ